MFRNSTALAAAAVFFLGLAGTPALSQDAHCGDFSGAAFGLCNAYCEAMACGSENQQASDNACDKVALKFDAISLETEELPCLVGPSTNAKPELDLSVPDETTFDTSATFVSFGGAVPIALDVAITDDNGDFITSATVTLKNPAAAENETLTLTPEGDSLVMNDLAGGNWSFDGGIGVLTITGGGTKAQYAEILQEVIYDNSDGSPSTDTRTITVQVSDGAADSNIAESLITVSVGCPCTAFSSGAMTHPGFFPFGRRAGTPNNLGIYSCDILPVGTNGNMVQIEYRYQSANPFSNPWVGYTFEGSAPLLSSYAVTVSKFFIFLLSEKRRYDDVPSDGCDPGEGGQNCPTYLNGQCSQSVNLSTSVSVFDVDDEFLTSISDDASIVRDHRCIGISDRDCPPLGSPPVQLSDFTPENLSACEADRHAMVTYIRDNLAQENDPPVVCTLR